jgi:hypothetical protein
MTKPFLDSYRGQTVHELIALKESHRIDSLVLAVEQAVGGRPRAELSNPERVVLAVEALEREVNNGGYKQFFTNSSCEFTAFVVQALQLIGCPECAAITAEAIGELDLADHFDAEAVERVASGLSDESSAKVGVCDSRYYENDESIDERLFAYIEQHAHEIQIPAAT